MTSGPSLSDSGLAPLLAAKGRLPLLPHPHIPRPRRIAALVTLLREHRLVVLSAGAFAGKTTLLAELVRTERAARTFWYTVDEVDEGARVLLEGLAYAISGTVPPGDEAHLLAHVVGALDTEAGTTVLIVDDVHRSAACLPLVERLLRYLPPRAHLLLSGRPHRAPRPPLWRWLEDQNQVAYLTGADLCLDDEERQRFQAVAGRSGGAWPVEYRHGGQAAIVDGLRAGVLPALEPELRAVVDLLRVLPAAAPPPLGAALSLPEADAAWRLRRPPEEAVLLQRPGATPHRLSAAAPQATPAELGPEA